MYFLGVGAGVIILGVFWAFAFLLCICSARSQSGLQFLGPIVFFLVLLLSIVLILIPRDPPGGTKTQTDDEKIYDYMFIARIFMIVFLLVMSLFSYVAFVSHHAAEVITAKPLRRRTVMRAS